MQVEKPKMKLLGQLAALLCLIVMVCSQNHHTRQCKHFVSPHDITYRVGIRHDGNEMGEDHLIGKRAIDKPFRMAVNYSASVSTELTASLQNRLETAVDTMKNFLHSVLFVRPHPEDIFLERDCSGWERLPPESGSDDSRCTYTCENITTCGEVSVPDAYLKACIQCNGNESNCQTVGSDGEGILNSDFLLLVSAIPNDTFGLCEVGAIAYAAVCQMEKDYDRPIAGYANFCPQAMDDIDDDTLVETAIHEVLHALGFSSGLYAWWRDENGEPRTPRNDDGYPPIDPTTGNYMISNNTMRTVSYTDWETRTGAVDHSVTMLVTPRIVQEARNHFNCPTLEGMELENQGGLGTELTHWEKRLVENEAMTGIATEDRVFSRLTFALLEDSGWYGVDYSKVSRLLWGRHQGCDFATKSCGELINKKKQQNQALTPFCNHLYDTSRLGCTLSRTAPSVCNLYAHPSELPTDYQYFESGANFNSSDYDLSKIGGFEETTDYCPYMEFKEAACSDYSNNLGTGFDNPAGEGHGFGARCVEQGDQPWTVSNGTLSVPHTIVGAGCYQYSCSASVVMITVFGSTYNCTKKGQIIDVEVSHSGFTHRGTLICPSCVDICYDDFENCPAAVELFTDLANPTDSSTIASTSSVNSTEAVTSPNNSTLDTSSGLVSMASPFLAMIAILVTVLMMQ